MDINRTIAGTALALLWSAGLLLGCSDPQQAASTDGEVGKVVATVNGAEITGQELDAYITHRQATQPGAPPDRQAALDELVKLEVVRQQAEKEGVAERDEVAAELDWLRTNLLVNTFMRERMDNMSFSEQELKAEYKAQLAKLSDREYKARHILTDDRKTAEETIEKLDAGADFTTLSEQQSSAPSAPQGGDLGWFSPDSMVPPFAAAIKTLEKGTYTKEPIKTQFGWHVILLEDSRESKPPAFSEVRDQLENILTSNALQSYIDKLRAGADIEMYGRATGKQPAS
jgi:peptidyl-prolyl cis-trans isomerase C